MSKQIQLSQGKYAIVDDEDFEYLNQFKWCATKSFNTFYATRSVKSGGKFTSIYMHRVILSTPKGVKVDHKDGDGLNNTKSNIRNCTDLENSMNKRKPKNNTSGFKGVHFHKGMWCSRIKVCGKKKHIGYFDCKIEAAKAYNNAAIKYHGEFANLNEIPAL